MEIPEGRPPTDEEWRRVGIVSTYRKTKKKLLIFFGVGILIAVGLFFLVGCTTEIIEPLGLDAERYEPDPIYLEWFAETVACVGIGGSFSAIDWYVVYGGPWYHEPSGHEISGMWLPRHSIFVEFRERLNEELVKHEMIHDLENDASHDSPAFGVCEDS